MPAPSDFLALDTFDHGGTLLRSAVYLAAWWAKPWGQTAIDMALLLCSRMPRGRLTRPAPCTPQVLLCLPPRRNLADVPGEKVGGMRVVLYSYACACLTSIRQLRRSP